MEFGKSRRPFQGWALRLLVIGLFGTCAPAVAAPVHFDIPEGDALKTLQLYYAQTHIELLYLSDTVRGIRTRAVSGELEPKDALARMLDGTGLEYSFEGDLSFVSIRRAAGEASGPQTPAALAAERNASRESDARIASLMARTPIPAEELQTVTVTGTLIRGVLDIMSPLTFVRRNDMKKASYATVQDALQDLPFNFGGGPSEDFAGTGNYARGVSANLRGLGPGATLVLVNGRRQPFSGLFGDFVDLSNVPWSAVERIEVLPDGASALYGSDAIAGVVNILLRKDLSGAESMARLGSAPGGADERLVSQLFGGEWRGGHAFAAYQYSERTSLAASHRPYAASTDKTAYGGSDHRTFRSSPGNILNPRTLTPEYAIPQLDANKQLSVNELISGQANLENTYATLDLLPERAAHSFLFNASQRLDDRFEAFVEGRYNERKIDQQLVPFSQVLMVPQTNPFIVNPYPQVPFVAVGYSFVDTLGPMLLDASTRTLSGVVGVNADLTDSWRVSLSTSYAREKLDAATANQPLQSVLNTALASGDPSTAFNPFGTNDPQVIEAIRFTRRDQAISTVTSATLVADGALLELPSGTVKLAVGGEWRQEHFSNRPREQSFFERHVESAYAELSVPIIGQAGNPWAAPRLELSLAGRYERYSDFGTTANPKVGLRWAPSNALKFRTSWATSFRAPKLVDIYDLSRNVVTLTALRDPQSPTGSSVVLALEGNNPNLNEETATTWTAGFDVAPRALPGFALSLTYYDIDYRDRILSASASAPADILLNESLWEAAVSRNPTRAQADAMCTSPFFKASTAQCLATPIDAIVDLTLRNMAVTHVKGIDFKLDHAIDSNLGDLELGLMGSYIFSFEQAASDRAPMVDVVNTVNNPLALKLRGTVDWSQRGWDQPGFGVSVGVSHTGGYRDDGDVGRRVAPLTTMDLRLSYRTPEDFGAFGSTELSMNATNIFDRWPPFVDREAGYDVANAEPYGRVLSISIQKNW